MQWTKERTTWLGTERELRGRWHGIPYVVRTHTTDGMTRRGWLMLGVIGLLWLAIVVLAQLVR